MSEWQPIETAPKDGTRIVLTWMENGKPQEIWPGMQWNPFVNNPLVQIGKGMWTLHGKNGELLCTWTEKNGGGPTHWMPLPEPPTEASK